MSSSFDPYRDWLAIAGDHRPPTWYELLGLPPGESNAARIEEAFYDRYARVRRYQIGAYGQTALRVLDELAQAFGALSDPERREQYDRSLATSEAEAGEHEVADATEVERVIESFLAAPSVESYAAAQKQAFDAAGNSGVVQFAQRVIRSGLRSKHLLTVLQQEAAARRQQLCQGCFEIFPLPKRANVTEVAITSRNDIVSEIMTISAVSNLWQCKASIQAFRDRWEGLLEIACVHRGGAALIGAAISALVMMLLGIALYEWSWGLKILLTLVVAGITGGLTARLYRPRFSSGLDVAWTIVAPAWTAGPPNETRAAFLSGLARVSIGRGDRRQRRKSVDLVCERLQNWSMDGHVSPEQLAKVFRLLLLDYSRDSASVSSSIHAMINLVEGAVRGYWPMETIDLVIRDGNVFRLLLPGVQVAMRWQLLKKLREAGLNVADLEELSRRNAGLSQILEQGRKRGISDAFVLLRHRPRTALLASLETAPELAFRGAYDRLAQFPNVLLVSEDGELVLTSEGVSWKGYRVRSAEAISWRTKISAGNLPTSYEVLIGERRIPYATSPGLIVTVIAALCDWQHRVLDVESQELRQRPPSGRLPPLDTNADIQCPQCGRRIDEPPTGKVSMKRK